MTSILCLGPSRLPISSTSIKSSIRFNLNCAIIFLPGIVRMWSIDYIQDPIRVPDQNPNIANENNSTDANAVEQIMPTQQPVNVMEQEQSDCESDVDLMPGECVQKQSPKTNETNKPQADDAISEMGEYVLINKMDSTVEKTKNQLKPGHAWTRALIYRNKLTMHTAYDRKDNVQPAAISAIALSKDNRMIYVGDTRGRLFSWTVNENPGRQRADHWQKDDVADACKACNLKFTFSERKVSHSN